MTIGGPWPDAALWIRLAQDVAVGFAVGLHDCGATLGRLQC